jgi:sigma-B regulation protein RsbU (phosphoserine phosphatase)
MQSRSFPAGSLAGDFYDVVEHPDGRVDAVIADVAGKGLGAGLIMAAAKSLIALAANQDSPGNALQELNARLFPVLGNREFVALAYARLDPARATLEIANAGLPDPYLLHTRGGVEVLGVGGNRLPLGLREGLPYSTLTRAVDPADRLLLVTDGIPEAVDMDGNPFGYEALTCLLESMNHPSGGRHSESSGAWVDRLLDQVSRRTGSMLDDDWTAVLLECHGPEG